MSPFTTAMQNKKKQATFVQPAVFICSQDRKQRKNKKERREKIPGSIYKPEQWKFQISSQIWQITDINICLTAKFKAPHTKLVWLIILTVKKSLISGIFVVSLINRFNEGLCKCQAV